MMAQGWVQEWAQGKEAAMALGLEQALALESALKSE